MTTSQIVWIAVISVAALLLIGLIVASMRKRSRADNHARAEQLREQAEGRAVGIPEASARADEAHAQAEQSRILAEREAERADAARAEVHQQEALHEDQIRAADRLDPAVDHKADDYSPQVSDPARQGESPATGASTTADTGTGTSRDTTSAPTSEPADTSPRDERMGAADGELRQRLEGDQSDGGTHRA